MNQKLAQSITLKSILKFTMPSILMMVIMSLYTVVDGAFVSNLIGTSAFSSVNIIYPLIGITVGVGTMFGTGLTAVVSTKLGQNKQREANQIFTSTIIFTILLGIIFSIISIIFIKDIIYMLGANDNIYQFCHDYAMPLIFFAFANILQIEFQSIYVANGQPHIGLIMTIIGGVANIILDYYFIAVLNMGISGAAIATAIGYAIPAFFGLCYFTFNRKHSLYFVRPVFYGKILIQTMSNGSSEMVSNLSTSVTTFLLNFIMMKIVGENGVAAIAILLYLDFILVAISMGYSIGVAPLISYNYGQENETKLKRIHTLSRRLCIGIGLTMTTGTLIFSSHLAGIFANPTSEVYALAVVGLSVFSFSYLFKGYNIYASAMFTAFGNGKISALLSFMRTMAFLVISIILFSYLFGVNGVWISIPIAEVFALGMSVFWITKYRPIYKI